MNDFLPDWINFCDEKLNRLQAYNLHLKDHGVTRGIIGPNEVADMWARHIINSAAVLALPLFQTQMKTNTNMADFGTGGGLPGVVLAILLPEYNFTLFDSQLKRLDFINEFCKLSGIKNVKVQHTRIEDAKENRQYLNLFDFAFSRAFLPIGIASELVFRYLQVGGQYIVYAGSNYELQIKALRKKLTGNLMSIAEVVAVPIADNMLHFIILEKLADSNVWPRKLKVIKKEWEELISHG